MKRSGILFIFGVFAAGLLAFAGCGEKKPHYPASVHHPIHAITTESKSDSEKLLQKASISCQSAEDCPSGLGMLVAIRNGGITKCTAFLLEKDLIVTNSHCIPSELNAVDPPSCEETIHIHFPDNGKHARSQASCGQILKQSDYANPRHLWSPDYAFIRLRDPVNRDTFDVSTEGVEDNLRLTMYKVDPVDQGDIPAGVITRETCTAKQNTLMYTPYTEASDPIISLYDCTSLPGNSGSPLVDGNGRVRAILQGALGTDLHEVLSELSSQYSTETLQIAYFATSFACIDYPGMPENSNKPVCQKRLGATEIGPKLKEWILKLTPKAEEELSGAISEWQSRSSTGLEWKVGSWSQAVSRPDRTQAAYFPKPSCFKREKSSNDRSLISSARTVKRAIQLTLRLPTWTLMESFNRYHQYQARLEPSEDLRAQLIFNPGLLANSAKTEVILIGNDAYAGSLVLMKEEIGNCRQETRLTR